MKNRAVSIVALCTASATVVGQSFSLDVAPEDQVVDIGETIEITIAFEPGQPDQVFVAGMLAVVRGAGASGNGVPTPGMWLYDSPFRHDGLASGADLTELRYLQLPAYGVRAVGDLYSYTWTATETGVARLDLGLTGTALGQFGGQQPTTQVPDGIAASLELRVVPLPPVGAALAFAGLAVLRRHRN